MKFELSCTVSGLRIVTRLDTLGDHPLKDGVNIAVGRSGIRLTKGTSHRWSKVCNSDTNYAVQLTHHHQCITWVPDYLFSQMAVVHEDNGTDVLLLWPPQETTRPPRAQNRGRVELTRDEARAYLFELVCEGNEQVYQNLVSDLAHSTQCLRALQQKG